MSLAELCRLHKIDMPKPDIYGRVKFVNPDANTHRCLMALSDYRIDLNFNTHPQEQQHIVILKAVNWE